ncbi:nucleotidyltransferase family protein [Mesorhizobium sp. M0293]|uniref:nucleotidyltransferase family protein n=1 Tax=unclassified Mesorhizobium TaxID=325217 RepID=UPI0033364FEF
MTLLSKVRKPVAICHLETLAGCLEGTSSFPTDLAGITDLTNRHLVTPQLFVAMVGHRPDTQQQMDFLSYWQEIHQLNEARNKHLTEQLEDLLKTLNAAGISPILLTGACSLVKSDDAFSAARMIADLDILLCPHESGRGLQALTQVGYLRCEEGPSRHTIAKLVKDGFIAMVHLHGAAPGTWEAMPVEDMSRDAEDVTLGSLHARILAPADRLSFLIGHDMIQDRGLLFGTLHLRHLLDAREICRRELVDWELVRSRFQSRARKLALGLYLENLARLCQFDDYAAPRRGAFYHLLYHRQTMLFEEKKYAAIDRAVLVRPVRAMRYIMRFSRLVGAPPY